MLLNVSETTPEIDTPYPASASVAETSVADSVKVESVMVSVVVVVDSSELR